MNEIDRVARALAVVHGELSPTGADKSRLRARILAPSTQPGPSDDAPRPSPQGLSARAAPALDRASRGSMRGRWAALRASGRVGLTLGAALLGAGVAVGFWWGSERAARSIESSPNRGATGVAADVARQAEIGGVARIANGALDTSAGVEAIIGVGPSSAAPSAGAPASMSTERAGTSAMAVPGRARGRSGAAGELPRARAASTPPRAAGPAASDAAADELALLRRIERAIRSGDPALALALLDELDQRFPATRLAEERLAARRLAECRAAEPGASERARRFVVEHPSSVYGRRLRLACALDLAERDRADRDEE